jgi:hypothetical protein
MKHSVRYSNSNIMTLSPDTWHQISQPVLNSAEEVGRGGKEQDLHEN